VLRSSSPLLPKKINHGPEKLPKGIAMLFSIFKWVAIAIVIVCLAFAAMFLFSIILIIQHGGA
jgi:hypothetical protein